jgi:TolB-like protein/Tfp pilus assembly protein PilF
MALLHELRRRRVFRTVAIYFVGCWLVMQVADVLFPGWGIAEDAIRFVVYAAVAGLPLVVLFAWAYDITPEGIRRTSPANQEESRPLTPRDRAWVGLLALLFIAVSLSFAQRVLEQREHGTPKSPEPGTVSPSNSLAILPFRDESMEPGGAEFLANGVHRDLMTNMMKISALDVIAPTSVERFRDTRLGSREIGQTLAVGHILEGMVQKAGARVRISVQLVQAESEVSLWAESYDRTLSADNLFDIQADIARQVADALETRLTPDEQSRVNEIPTEVFAAYEAVARGNLAFDESDSEAFEAAEAFYLSAIELEPDFAQAHALLGQLYLQSFQFGGLDRESAYRRADARLTRAIDLDESVAMAYAWLAVIVRDRDRDFERALELLDIGLRHEPGNSRIMHIKGLTLRLIGRMEESLFWYERAMRLDPLSLIVNESYGSALRDAAQFEKAEVQYGKAIEMDPDFPHTWWGMGSLLWSRGDPASALEWFHGAIERAPASDAFYAWVSLLHLELGQDGAASTSLERGFEALGEAEQHDLEFMRRMLLAYRGEDASAIHPTWGEESHVWFGNVMRVPSPALIAGRHAEAIQDYRSRYPELARPDRSLNATNYRAAIDLALALSRIGEEEAANQLLDRAYAFLLTQPRLGFRGYWIEDARVAAIRGDHEAALSRLQEAVKAGWRNLWWFYFWRDPALIALRDDDRFQELARRVEDDMTSRVR